MQSGEESLESSECDKFSVRFLSSLDKTINLFIMRAIEQGLIEARLTSVAPEECDGNRSGAKGDAAEGYRLFRAGMPGTQENMLRTVAIAESCQTLGHCPYTDGHEQILPCS